MQDPRAENESVEFEVKPQAPRLRGKPIVLAGLGVGAVAIVAVIVALIANRTAAPPGDPLAKVMPANVAFYFSMTTRPHEQPNFGVVTEAWKDSREAGQIEDGLQSALAFTGFDWEKDILPWLGDRAAIGVVDLGGYETPAEVPDQGYTYPRYRTPFMVLAVQTRDRAKSDAFLADFRAQRESSLSGDSAVMDQTYRNIPIVYVANNSDYMSPYGEAYATIDDMIVFTLSGPDDLKKVIDAALDGTNLNASDKFAGVMRALPDPNVAAFYMDYGRYMEATLAMQAGMPASYGDDSFMTAMREQQQKQLEQARQLAQAIGGIAAVMTYEPGGIRFDMATQLRVDQLPESMRGLYDADLPAAPNRIFDAIPSSAIAAMNMSNPGGVWGRLLDSPDYLQLVFGAYPGADNLAETIAKFEQAAGVDLNADLLGLLNGEMSFVVLPNLDEQPAPHPIDQFSYSFFPRLPFRFAAMFDSTDAARVQDNLSKALEALLQIPQRSYARVQPLSGLPYTALVDQNGGPMLVYGVVDGRFVIGSDSDTLLAIDAADQSPLSADATFKKAMAVLPGNRLSSGYLNLAPLWDMLAQAGDTSVNGVLTYLRPIQWMSLASEPPDKSTGIQRATLHVGIEAVK